MDDFNEGWVPATFLEPIYGGGEVGCQVLDAGEGVLFMPLSTIVLLYCMCCTACVTACVVHSTVTSATCTLYVLVSVTLCHCILI